MKAFMDKDFMLYNETAVKLYHDYATKMPIYDYHCHLPANEIAENKRYKNITELWLSGDHYKWRAMRSNGVDEKYITGVGSDKEKFLAFAGTVERLIGNPIYHWTHLELQRYFDIEETLSSKSADAIWEACNKKLACDEFSAKGLIDKSNVKVICTTDDPCDDLKFHKEIAKDKTFSTKVLPTYRPDKGINIELNSFKAWVEAFSGVLEQADENRVKIKSAEELLSGLIERVDYFHKTGCRIADHGMEIVHYKTPNMKVANEAFNKAMNGEELSLYEIETFKGTLINALGKKYASLGWTLQLHIGAIRNNNSRMFNSIGADSGFDSIGDSVFAEKLSLMLDDMDREDQLPKTILYTLNPRDNYVLGTMIGNFQGGSVRNGDGELTSVKGKIQFGSGWWFNDQRDGMEAQISALANLGILSNFVGMLTDSRSFTSYPRHEYFRRILCNKLGEWVEAGEFPNDMELLGGIVEDICYRNAERYFEI